MNNCQRYVVFDVETTGLYPHKGDRIIEIGGIVIEDGRMIEEFTTLIDVGEPIPKSAQRIHGITNEMTQGKPTPYEAITGFYDFIINGTLIAHNAKFDCKFLKYEFGKLGLALDNRSICTLRLSRRLLPRLSNHRLGTVYRHLFGTLPQETNLHRALDDARLTAKVWLKLNEMSN